MICLVQYWNTQEKNADTDFLFIANVLEEAVSPSAETLYNVIKCPGISTDSAAVMAGKREGVVTKLKTDNPSLLAIHYICHRLALACVDTNHKDLDCIKEVESYVTSIWKVCHCSPLSNSAARLVTRTRLREHITPVLRDLH
ncbi:hypothetical protein SNE40_001808 [Patella caerulea]|uniref:Uncharacterized protein n=1 Tax=Patella caerulea TaxID=87958 RepID=A0AAN8KE28_PATCE